ncbi:hypothetical protein [Actinoplanes sp. NPDC049118]|uniref:hypothetical protein n=1 Tax=Actinoplanes sp. NPDC049118 TaxID=3155769 RepID=UPI0033ED4FF1
MTSTLQVLADVAHSLAGEHPGPDPQLRPAATFGRLLFLGAGAATAGLALLRPLTPRPRRYAARAVAALAVAAGLATIQLDGAPVLPVLATVAALLAAHLSLGRPRLALAAGAVAAALLAARTTGDAGVAGAVQVLAAAVWLGAAAAVRQAGTAERGALAARLAPWLLPPAAAAAAGGVQLGPTAFGLILIGEATVAVVVAACWRSTARLGAAAVAALAVAVGGGTAAAAMPPAPAPPAAGAVAGGPLLTQVVLTGRRTPVLVVPQRPGWNLVHVGAERAAVGTDRDDLTAATARPGATQGWARIRLPAGRSRLWVTAGGDTAAVEVDTTEGAGLAALDGPDGPECAGAALGALTGGATTPLTGCPADRLSDEDASALRATVRFLAGRGVRGVALSGDASPRGTAAAGEVTAEATRAGLAVERPGTGRVPLIIVSGWAAADPLLRDVGVGRTPAEGTYLAPWLLTTTLLDHPAGQVLPLRYGPRDLNAVRYAAELGDRFPGEPASAAGYASWLAARRLTARGPLRLYAASRVFLPGAHGPDPAASAPAHAAHAAASWFPGGTVVAVTGPITEPTA